MLLYVLYNFYNKNQEKIVRLVVKKVSTFEKDAACVVEKAMRKVKSRLELFILKFILVLIAIHFLKQRTLIRSL
jgi:hypothetical protein